MPLRTSGRMPGPRSAQIPRIFHQIWVGSDPMPSDVERWRASWRDHHPEWELRLWTEDNLPEDFRTPAAYERERHPVERADIIRLEVLWTHGGVYVDSDLECLRPIDDLIHALDFFGACIKPGRITNTVIGSAPGHPILDRALRKLRPQKPGVRFDKSKSGPLFLDRIVGGSRRVKKFPPEVFFPTTPEQRERAYAVHHAIRAWKSPDDWRHVALRLEAQLAEARGELEATKAELEAARRRAGSSATASRSARAGLR